MSSIFKTPKTEVLTFAVEHGWQHDKLTAHRDGTFTVEFHDFMYSTHYLGGYKQRISHPRIDILRAGSKSNPNGFYVSWITFHFLDETPDPADDTPEPDVLEPGYAQSEQPNGDAVHDTILGLLTDDDALVATAQAQMIAEAQADGSVTVKDEAGRELSKRDFWAQVLMNDLLPERGYTNVFASNDVDGQPYRLTVCDLAPDYGLDDLRHALQGIVPASAIALNVIVGDGDEAADISLFELVQWLEATSAGEIDPRRFRHLANTDRNDAVSLRKPALLIYDKDWTTLEITRQPRLRKAGSRAYQQEPIHAYHRVYQTRKMTNATFRRFQRLLHFHWHKASEDVQYIVRRVINQGER